LTLLPPANIGNFTAEPLCGH